MQPRDQEALALYQETKSEPRAVAEKLLDQFFNFPSLAEFEARQAAVTQEMEFAS